MPVDREKKDSLQGAEILCEDAQLLAVYKPAGLAVQTKQFGQRDLESILKNYLAVKGQGTYLGIVHRLDQPVEGLLVFARTPEAAAALSAQASGKRPAADDGMRKEYLAVTDGCMPEPKGELRDWLLKDGRTNTSKAVPKGTKGAKEAILEYEVLDTQGRMQLVRITLHTGRHHQIRVQLAHAGAPLFGDVKYHPPMAEPAAVRQRAGTVSLALCAYRLSFFHPRTAKRMIFVCEPKNPLFQNFRVDKAGVTGIQ